MCVCETKDEIKWQRGVLARLDCQPMAIPRIPARLEIRVYGTGRLWFGVGIVWQGLSLSQRPQGYRMNKPRWSVRRLHSLDQAHVEALADLLIDCVAGGASVSFMHPLSRERAVAFWRGVAQGVAAGERALLVAEHAHGLCGTVQLVLAQPQNQPHRADLVKMLVHRRARRQGVGAALLQAAEEVARECGKTLLVLDTVSNSDAARLYERLGWATSARFPVMPC